MGTVGFDNRIFFLTLTIMFAGEHSAQNFAELHYNVLSDYGIVGSLSAITADNASTNSAMARAISRIEHVEFNHKGQLFGCMAHVIHLAAMDGITALGGKDYLHIEDEESAATCVISVHNITTQPDGLDVNLTTVLKRVHGYVSLCTSF